MRSWSWLMLVALLGAPLEGLPEEEMEELPVARVIRQIVFPGQERHRPSPARFPSGGFQPGGAPPRGFQPGGAPPGRFQPVGAPPGVRGCHCVPVVACASKLERIQQGCFLSNSVEGVCCPVLAAAAAAVTRTIFPASRVRVSMGQLDRNLVDHACDEGIKQVNGLAPIEQNLVQNSIVLPKNTPASSHLRVFKISNRAKRMDRSASAIVSATTNMVKQFSLTKEEGGHGLRNMQVADTKLRGMCPQNPSCDARSKYRTADGSCNNLRNPTWGMSNTPTQRILPPAYDDGVSSPRTRATDGSILPNVRNIANNIMVDVNSPDQVFTSSVMQWAQFLDHDFAHIPFPTMANGEGIECCPGGREAPANLRHPRCWPIDTTGDLFYGPRGSNCMNFVRSMVAVGAGQDCTFGYAEQLNQLTHWIDGSSVYGSTIEEQHSLRTGRNGLMKTSGDNLLPINPDQGGECEAQENGARCFLAGDSRSNEQPGLTAIHTVWLRQHNRVARELQNVNPRWNDETVFQEARRIIVAQIQHITYNEWLPIIVGDSFMHSFGINIVDNGYSFDYNANLNPNMNNEFSTAAFRFGHSLVQGTLRLFSDLGSTSSIQLRHHFNSPHLIQRDGRFDEIIRSFTQLAIQKFDSFITEELSNHLFQTPRFNFGMDLMSINMQRGRDHGIATYNNIRQVCGLRRAASFSDLTDQIDPETVNELAKLYRSVDDIDFFAGGISERPVSGGLLGWTFLCVVGDQFARLKKGDRFFYDLGGQPGSFTENQLNEIRKTSWARILCDNARVNAVQPLAFRQTQSRFNQPVPCNNPIIPQLNYFMWRS